MILNRRSLLAAVPSLAVWPALAEEAPPVLAAYERETGGRIGVYAETLATGAKIAWRAEERFVMCSTFKASLAALALARVDRGEGSAGEHGAVQCCRPAPPCSRGQAEPGKRCDVGRRYVQGRRRA